jgi:hypothetical protein
LTTSWLSWPPGFGVVRNRFGSWRVCAAYHHDAFAPAACPLSPEESDPVSMSEVCLTDRDNRVKLHAHAEVKLESRGGDLEGASNIAFGEGVEEVVRRDRVLHDVEVGRALEEMLALSRSILRADLLTVDALDRETLASH